MAENTKQMAQQMAQMISASKDLQGTFLEDLFEVMAEGNFTDIPEDVDSSYERVIGEMTFTEKALATLRDRYEEEEKELVSKEDTLAINKARRRFRVANNFLWSNINDRFPTVDGIALGIRKGFCVVVMGDEISEAIGAFFRLIKGEGTMR